MSLSGIFLKQNLLTLVNRESLSKKTKPSKILLEKAPLQIVLHGQDNFGSSRYLPKRVFTRRPLLTKKFEPNQILNKEAIFFLLLFKTAYCLKINNLPAEIKLTETLKAQFPNPFLAPEYLDDFLLFFNEQVYCIGSIANFSIMRSIETVISNTFQSRLHISHHEIQKNSLLIAEVKQFLSQHSFDIIESKNMLKAYLKENHAGILTQEELIIVESIALSYIANPESIPHKEISDLWHIILPNTLDELKFVFLAIILDLSRSLKQDNLLWMTVSKLLIYFNNSNSLSQEIERKRNLNLEIIALKVEKNYRGIARIEEQAKIALEFFKDKFLLRESDFDRIKEVHVNQHLFKR
jgi:hypothetical protein